ncbi:MAG: hypothetical protein M1817_004530 [Caeruleum heppii]|nr:MAG: hypothetical protein M1817_004530 [Caeruleum heppii]
MSQDRFTLLAKELQDSILDYCDARDLFAFCQTSRSICQSTLPRLYRTVDLSVHNLKGTFTNKAGNPVEADYFGRVAEEIDHVVFARQQQFVGTLLQRPDYGRYIRTLIWTFITPPERAEGSDSAERHDVSNVWRAFQSITRVHHVDIAFLAKSLDPFAHSVSEEDHSQFRLGKRKRAEKEGPPPIFASAGSLRLSGSTPRCIVNAILHAVEPSRLTSLELNNLLDPGQELDDDPQRWYRATVDHDNVRLLGTDAAIGDAATLPCPMSGHLRHLEGRCTALTSLCVRGVGQGNEYEDCWVSANDDARYREWASFITSVQATLTSFTFEQGMPADDEDHRRPIKCRHGVMFPYFDMRPMDARFEKFIVPVLGNDQWPQIKNMTLQGIGGRDGNYRGRFFPSPDVIEESERLRERIRAAVPDGLQLLIEEDATRRFASAFLDD